VEEEAIFVFNAGIEMLRELELEVQLLGIVLEDLLLRVNWWTLIGY
jgi:hypothetical protein